MDNSLQGYNGGIICYGETGTGKTYTIKEIIPQVVSQIFNYINESDSGNELFKIDVSIIEIYKEQVNDLIDKNNTNLNLVETKNKNLIIDNLTHVGVSTKEQLTKIINKGLLNRNNNSPPYSEHNSKSHFIIMITLFHYYRQKNYMKIGKLYLVDLEGSERVSKTKMEGVPLEEQKLINKSLIALSRIVQNLSNEYDNITYAPYRDSKLTRIISDFFGGNAYTSLILNCSKHECSTIETRNTLMFGERCKLIKNNPEINIEQNVAQTLILDDIFGKENIQNDFGKNYDLNEENSMDSGNLERIMNKYKCKNYANDDIDKKNNHKDIDKDMNDNRDKYMNRSNDNMDKYYNKTMNKYIDESMEKGNEDKNMNKSMDKINFKNGEWKNKKFLKMKEKQLRDNMDFDNPPFEKLNERNQILENKNKKLRNEFSKFGNNKDLELEKEINNCYAKNNINNLHNLLNEKEQNEKDLIKEMNSIKMIYERKIEELNDIINAKQKEILEIKENQNDNINTCHELTECLNEAGNQLQIKEKMIEELISKNENKTKENTELINTINNLKQGNDNNNNEKVFQQEKEDITNLNKKIAELNNELENKENIINNLNKEKNEYDNKINEMNNIINLKYILQ